MRGVDLKQTLTAHDFVELFQEGWRSPEGVEGVLAFFGPYLDPAVHVTGPLTPDCHGTAQVEEYFRLLFAVIPDLHGHVIESEVESDEVVYLTVQLAGTIGRRAVALRLRDKLTVRDGRLVERVAKGMPLSVTRAIVLTPRAWRSAARLMIRLRWSAPAVRAAG